MCLLKDNSIKPKKPNTEGFCIGWKVIRDNNIAPFRTNYLYKLGVNKALSPTNDDLIDIANVDNRVDTGLHLFLTRKDARTDIKNWNEWKRITKNANGFKIIKVYYKPEYVISYGVFPTGICDLTPCVAVKKLTVKSLNHVK